MAFFGAALLVFIIIVVMVPVLMAAGLPVEGMGILLGVDTIPDMFRTATNVTADMSAAVVLGRGEEGEVSGNEREAA